MDVESLCVFGTVAPPYTGQQLIASSKLTDGRNEGAKEIVLQP